MLHQTAEGTTRKSAVFSHKKVKVLGMVKVNTELRNTVAVISLL
jgi:hypothetical protein